MPRGGPSGAFVTEWLTAYADYLRRAAEQSANTLDLYQQITDRMVRGELAPTATQDMLGSFVQARGTAYSDRLAQLNMRFFSEMVRIGTAFAHELGHALLPDAPAPPPVPPFDASDPAGWFQQLGDYAEQLSASIAGTYQTLADRAAAGDLAPGQIQEATNAHLQRRLPEYLSELGRLYFDLLEGLTELRVESEQEFLTGMLQRVNGAGHAEAFELTFAGPLGGTATASLSITNSRDELARIRCDVSEVRRADGVGPAFAADVGVEPDGLELEPEEEGLLVVTLRLDEGTYEPDVLYVGTLQIAGHGEPRLEVPLRITATGPVATHGLMAGGNGAGPAPAFEPIAIIGMRGRFPGANDLETYWENLAGGVESITTLSREEMRAAGVADEITQLPGYVNAAPLLGRRRPVRRRVLRLLGARRGAHRSAAPAVPGDDVGGARGRRLRPCDATPARSGSSAAASSARTSTSST